MSEYPHILSTRKLVSVKINELLVKGCKVIHHDFIRKVINFPSDLQPQAIHTDVILTSSTGVQSFIEILRQLRLDKNTYRVHCLSSTTNELASTYGLNIKSLAPNASSLADEILKNSEVKMVTHISSNLTREDISKKLVSAGVAVQQIIGYLTEFSPKVIRSKYDAIIFFSPSAVDSFLSMNPLAPLPCFCIGKTTAEHAKQEGYQQIHISDAPTEESVIQSILNYYSKSPVNAKE